MISSQPENLPDFIIAGATKSATTTLHTILNKHPDVFIPNGELHFFDMDDIFEHPDFNEFDKFENKWYYHLKDLNQDIKLIIICSKTIKQN